MYCAYPVPGMGSNSLMYYYNGKSVSTLSGNARVCVCLCVSDREELYKVCMCVCECIPSTVILILSELFPLDSFELSKHFVHVCV